MNPYPYTSLPDLTGGACLEPGVDRALFHPEGLGARQQADAALAICARCPEAIATRCLTDALDYERKTGETHGVIGATDEYQRAALLGIRKRGRADVA